jgi:hypothetical protein
VKIHIDISGQIQQRNLDSSLGFKRSDGVNKAVFLPKRTKKALLRKYKGQIINLVEKIHCIMVYYCIKDSLKGVTEIHICRDVNFRVVKRLLPFLFKGHSSFSDIKIAVRNRCDPTSNGHWPALKAFRRRRYATIILKKEMIEKKLLEFDNM